MATYLDEILAQHRRTAELDQRQPADLEQLVEGLAATRDFAQALRAGSVRGERVGVIAEVKRRSPSKGDLAPLLDPAELARSYAKGDAACLSVLTDGPHFSGSAADLKAARAAVELPVLRKDFTVCAADVYDARAMGADALLLIVAALSDEELARFLSLSSALGLAALVEVHDQSELARALGAGASIIGVNQRDLHSFAVEPARALQLVASIPEGVLRVAESGISTAEQVRQLSLAGYDAILVGESLLRASDPARKLRELSGTGALGLVR